MSETDHRVTYLDHAATSPPLSGEAAPGVSTWANPSSPHKEGARAARALEESRAFLAGTVGAARLVFTSGATEANNLAILGRTRTNRPGRVLALTTDHASILEPLKVVAGQGRRVDLLPVDGEGRVTAAALAEALDAEVILLCLVVGNNETGALQDLEEITGAVRERCPEAQVHVDGVQAYGRLRLDLDDQRFDSLSLSGHKIGAPPGIGALALGPRARLQPLVHGGGQEEGLRAGTENLPGAVALARAAEAALARGHLEWDRLHRLRDTLLAGLESALPDCRLNGPRTGGLPHILNLSFPGVPAEVLVHHLADEGIMVGTGSACSGRHKGPSHVLTAMGVPPGTAAGSLRFSFGPATAAEDVDRVLQALPPLVARLRRIGGRR